MDNVQRVLQNRLQLFPSRFSLGDLVILDLGSMTAPGQDNYVRYSLRYCPALERWVVGHRLESNMASVFRLDVRDNVWYTLREPWAQYSVSDKQPVGPCPALPTT